ncbi:MAG: hypothetical protein R2762_03145 [Bryobacteraceae bacterium]
MQVMQVGAHKVLYLELQTEPVQEICRELGVDCQVQETPRAIVVEATATGRQAPLLLFDARDPGNLGWFARCQFYVDGQTAAVLQTPITVANQRDARGQVVPNAIRLQISKELPAGFRLPGPHAVSEQVVYNVFANFMTALLNKGVAVCGGGLVKPLAGRGDSAGPQG